MKTHGVLTDHEILFQYGNCIQTYPIANLYDLERILQLAGACNIDTLWMQPGAEVSYWPAPGDLRQIGAWELRGSTVRMNGYDILRNVSARQGKIWINLTWPEHTTYEWPGQPAPETMLTSIDYLGQAFGTPMHHNAGVMGRNQMQQLNSSERRSAWLADLGEIADQLPEISGEGYAYVAGIEEPEEYLRAWKHRHNHDGDVYIHARDCNSQYPNAAKYARFGVGTPFYCPPGARFLTMEQAGKRAGLWHLEDIMAEEDSLLVRFNPLEAGQAWVTTPMLRLLASEGAQFTITEAWVWPEKHAILDTWSDAFWGAREALKKDVSRFPDADSRALALYSAKRIGAAAIGLLKSPESQKYCATWYRPDWWHTIVEEARCRVYWLVKKIYEQYGELPLMAATDALYYLSTSPDPAELFPGAWRDGEALGGWKEKSDERFPRVATPENLACFSSENTPGMAIVALRKV